MPRILSCSFKVIVANSGATYKHFDFFWLKNQFHENFRENDFTEKVSIFLDVMKWKKMKKFENELTSKTK